MEIIEISKTKRQADSQVVVALISTVQVAGTFGHMAL